MAALTSCGTIPETGDYSVLLEPQVEAIGTVNEDFAVESLSGDVFQLGNASYRILRVEPGRVRVEDARGEIRAGRFIGGLLGEQFALPEAIGLLRQVRRQPHDGAWLCVAAADPANLPGSVLPCRAAGAARARRTGAVPRRRAGGDLGRRAFRAVAGIERCRQRAGTAATDRSVCIRCARCDRGHARLPALSRDPRQTDVQ